MCSNTEVQEHSITLTHFILIFYKLCTTHYKIIKTKAFPLVGTVDDRYSHGVTHREEFGNLVLTPISQRLYNTLIRHMRLIRVNTSSAIIIIFIFYIARYLP